MGRIRANEPLNDRPRLKKKPGCPGITTSTVSTMRVIGPPLIVVA
jgi:hypothetical protein